MAFESAYNKNEGSVNLMDVSLSHLSKRSRAIVASFLAASVIVCVFAPRPAQAFEAAKEMTRKEEHMSSEKESIKSCLSALVSDEAIKNAVVLEKDLNEGIAENLDGIEDQLPDPNLAHLVDRLSLKIDPLMEETGHKMMVMPHPRMAKEASYWGVEVYEAMSYAVETGLYDTIVSLCKELNVSEDNFLSLCFFESRLAKNLKNRKSTAGGLMQIMDRRFLSLFMDYGAEALPIVKKTSPALYDLMKPFVGVVSLKASAINHKANFVFDIAQYKKNVGPKTFKKSDAALREEIKTSILLLRNPKIDSEKERDVLSILFVLMDQKKNKTTSKLACEQRMGHQFGEGGGRMIIKEAMRNPETPLYSVLMNVFAKTVPDKRERDAYVKKVMIDNRIVGPDMSGYNHIGTKSYVAAKESRERIVRNCLRQWREKLIAARQLNERLLKQGSSLRVNYMEKGKIVFSLVDSIQRPVPLQKQSEGFVIK